MMAEYRSSGLFDRFAAWSGDNVARAWFFVACVLLVVVWVPTLFFLDMNTSQLLINTATTIITFVLVALLQNTQARTTAALAHKLDALLEANAEILDNTDGVDKSGGTAQQLREMAGVEMEA